MDILLRIFVKKQKHMINWFDDWYLSFLKCIMFFQPLYPYLYVCLASSYEQVRQSLVAKAELMTCFFGYVLVLRVVQLYIDKDAGLWTDSQPRTYVQI